jgi:saccharopine dehydrogenase (NAD+, L-lysine-forming)
MSNILVIGAGGVARVTLHKFAQNRDIFSSLTLASRTISRCELYQKELKDRYDFDIDIAKVNADNVEELTTLIDRVKPYIVLNIALPYQDLTIMEACLETKTHYLDTANYEHPDSAKFEYKEQWAYHERYKQSNILALLGSGFDPGVTNVFCAYLQKTLL